MRLFKGSLLILILFLLNTNKLAAQFTHRLEMNAAFIGGLQKEVLFHEKDFINFSENLKRAGNGFVIGSSYNLSKMPFSFSLQYMDMDYILKEHTTNIKRVYDAYHNLNNKALSLQINYSIKRKSVLTPELFIGAVFSNIDLERRNISFISEIPPGSNLSEFEWGFEEVKAQFNTIGFSMGAKLKMRLTDKSGLYLKKTVETFKQDKTDWLDQSLIFHSNEFGVYIRLLKRKDIYK